MLSDGPSKGGVDEISLWKPPVNNTKETEHSSNASSAWGQDMCTPSYFIKLIARSLLSSEEIKDKKTKWGGKGCLREITYV